MHSHCFVNNNKIRTYDSMEPIWNGFETAIIQYCIVCLAHFGRVFVMCLLFALVCSSYAKTALKRKLTFTHVWPCHGEIYAIVPFVFKIQWFVSALYECIHQRILSAFFECCFQLTNSFTCSIFNAQHSAFNVQYSMACAFAQFTPYFKW